MVELDLKNGYLQGARMQTKDARVAMLNPDGRSARYLLGPIYGYPNAGIHFDIAMCQSLPPEVTDKGYVDDMVDGKHTVVKFLHSHIKTLRALLDNNNTISIKKYWLRQRLEKFGAIVSPSGVSVDTQVLQDLVALQTPKSLEDFKSQAHKILYFGQFIPTIAQGISKISDYWHKKTEMPSKVQREKDWGDVIALVRKHITLNHFDPSLQTFVGLDWSETGEFYMMFQVDERVQGNPAVHIVSHSQKLHKTKYERTAPAFTGELANTTRAFRELEHELSRCASTTVMILDCQPIVKASLNDFRSLFTIGNKKHQRELMEFLHVYPSLNVRFVHINRELNPICDFYSYKDVEEPQFRPLQRRTGEAKDGELLYSSSESPAGEGKIGRRYAMMSVDHDAKPDTRKKQYEERLQFLENAADKNPTDEFAPILRLIKDGRVLDVQELKPILHDDDLREVTLLTGKPNLIEFKGEKIYVRGDLYLPPKVRFEAIRKAHSIPEAGHFAYATTMHNLQGFYFPGMAKDVEAFIKLCGPCDRENGGPEKVVPRPNPVFYPFEKIYIDFKPAGKDDDVKGFIVIKESCLGVVSITSTDSKETGAWIHAVNKWIATYGPFQELTSDCDAAITSKAFMSFAERLGFKIRTTSPYNKSNGCVESEMKLINWYLAKVGGDQSDLGSMAEKMAIALNSRARFRCAGLFLNVYGLIRGFYSRSIAERTLGVDLQHILGEFNLVDWIISSAQTRGEFIKQNLDRRGIPFEPKDLTGSGYPEMYPVGTRVWVTTKALPSDIVGNRKTTAKGTGPFEIVMWKDSGMTAQLKELNKPSHVIERNVRFFYPVNAEKKDAVGAKEYQIEEILGEKRTGRGLKPTHYLVHFTGYGPEYAEWTPVENITADELLQTWKQLPLQVRKERTEKALKMQAKDSPARRDGYRRAAGPKQ